MDLETGAGAASGSGAGDAASITTGAATGATTTASATTGAGAGETTTVSVGATTAAGATGVAALGAGRAVGRREEAAGLRGVVIVPVLEVRSWSVGKADAAALKIGDDLMGLNGHKTLFAPLLQCTIPVTMPNP
ncbi:MAG: hypothetical protein ACOVKO_03405 [Elstera sp.]